MKIVVVNDASLARGGATGLSLLQAKLLHERGLEVVFVAADRGGNEELELSGIRSYCAGNDPLTKAPKHVAMTRGLYNPNVSALLRSVIAKEDGPDTVYHVHSWSKTLTPAVFSALQSVASRVFIHAHDFFLACPNGGFMDYKAMQPCHRDALSMSCLSTNCDKRSYAQKGWRVARQLVLQRALPRHAPWAGILMIHPAMADRLEAYGYPRESLVPLRNPAVALASERITAEANGGYLFIGRVEPEKGVEELITAAGATGVALTAIGDGPLREELMARYPEVTFPGWLTRDEMLQHARRARALIMPSRYPEPFGLVAAEASLAGLPVIVSKGALLGPEIADRKLGWMVDTRDPDLFAALLSEVAALPEEEIRAISLRAFSGEAGLCLSPEAWIDAQLGLYASALDRAPVSAA